MKLTIMNETGHTDMVVTAPEVIEQITDHPTHWVFVDGEMVSTYCDIVTSGDAGR